MVHARLNHDLALSTLRSCQKRFAMDAGRIRGCVVDSSFKPPTRFAHALATVSAICNRLAHSAPLAGTLQTLRQQGVRRLDRLRVDPGGIAALPGARRREPATRFWGCGSSPAFEYRQLCRCCFAAPTSPPRSTGGSRRGTADIPSCTAVRAASASPCTSSSCLSMSHIFCRPELFETLRQHPHSAPLPRRQPRAPRSPTSSTPARSRLPARGSSPVTRARAPAPGSQTRA